MRRTPDARFGEGRRGKINYSFPRRGTRPRLEVSERIGSTIEVNTDSRCRIASFRVAEPRKIDISEIVIKMWRKPKLKARSSCASTGGNFTRCDDIFSYGEKSFDPFSTEIVRQKKRAIFIFPAVVARGIIRKLLEQRSERSR